MQHLNYFCQRTFVWKSARSQSPPRNSKRAREDDAAALEEEKKRQRLERLKQWKAKTQQQQSPSKSAPSSSASTGKPAASKAVSLSLSLARKKPGSNVAALFEDDEQDLQAHGNARKAKLKFLPALDDLENSGSTGEQLQKQQEQQPQVDPLDAYMSTITGSQELQEEKDLNIETTSKSTVPEMGSTAAVITLDEIFSNDKPPQHDDEGEEFREQFLTELKKRREKEEELRLKAEMEEKQALLESHKELGKGGSSNEGVGLMAEDDGGIETIMLNDGRDGPSALEVLREKLRKRQVKEVDHTKIEYISFRKDFYLESPAIRNLSDAEVKSIRQELEIKVRGTKPYPKPISTWNETGLSERIIDVLNRREWTKPFPIQRQSIPAIMSGRDLIGVAKTGSGKTLAFVLPMLRHVLDQPPLRGGDGPIALLLAPARELASQIHTEVRKFTKTLNLKSCVCYGGVGIQQQIAQIKGLPEIVVGTPGRLIELLCINNGTLLTLHRVTYVVLDEADRMFDMGFEPQITRIMQNIRPDRQTVMFTATFPPIVERAASKFLTCKPLVIIVGGRSKPSVDIRQVVEVHEPHEKFPRLLQLLGEWYDSGRVIVFVNSQDRCDKLFSQLLQAGYRCLSLHAGKDQSDRDCSISDFKQGHLNLMIATSVAARGLDVEDLNLVVNYDCPSHIEDYVHRVGRTGRAGKMGTAYTFIGPDEEALSLDLVKALTSVNQTVPQPLQEMADRFKQKVEIGEAKRFRNSGYLGHGFTFEEGEKSEKDKQMDLLRQKEEISLGLRDEDEVEERNDEAEKVLVDHEPKKQQVSTHLPSAAESALEKIRRLAKQNSSTSSSSTAATTTKGTSATTTISPKQASAGNGIIEQNGMFWGEVEINSYPQTTRFKITQGDTLNAITEITGCGIVCRGVHVPPGRTVSVAGERPLYLRIEGSSAYEVTRAKNELQRRLDEITMAGMGRAVKAAASKYSVI